MRRGGCPPPRYGGRRPSPWRRLTQPSRVSALSHSASVEGRWRWGTPEMRRVFGSGSRRLMKRVSTPVLMYRNGSGLTGGSSPAGRPVAYLFRLQLDAGQRVSGGLGLQDPNGLAVDEQHVIGEAVAVRHLELADGDARSSGEIQFGSVLDKPTGGVQGLVDLLSGLLLWRKGRQLVVSPAGSQSVGLVRPLCQWGTHTTASDVRATARIIADAVEEGKAVLGGARRSWRAFHDKNGLSGRCSLCAAGTVSGTVAEIWQESVP